MEQTSSERSENPNSVQGIRWLCTNYLIQEIIHFTVTIRIKTLNQQGRFHDGFSCTEYPLIWSGRSLGNNPESWPTPKSRVMSRVFCYYSELVYCNLPLLSSPGMTDPTALMLLFNEYLNKPTNRTCEKDPDCWMTSDTAAPLIHHSKMLKST